MRANCSARERTASCRRRSTRTGRRRRGGGLFLARCPPVAARSQARTACAGRRARAQARGWGGAPSLLPFCFRFVYPRSSSICTSRCLRFHISFALRMKSGL
ncbi:hypothetical protein B0H14DRAFT_3140448 [Mycena olivaceomarginata]|nr:hypothetical protein B0H14DRAFT_3140448 [Mycena olivaceomarginata]